MSSDSDTDEEAVEAPESLRQADSDSEPESPVNENTTRPRRATQRPKHLQDYI